MKGDSKPFLCFLGAYCGHAILTVTAGVYHCPFGGQCFKEFEKAEKDTRLSI